MLLFRIKPSPTFGDASSDLEARLQHARQAVTDGQLYPGLSLLS